MKFTFIWLIVIGFLIGYILTNPKPKAEVIIKYDSIVRIDTIKIPIAIKREKPKPTFILDSGINEIKVYKRDILNDSLGKLEIIDSVQHNQLLGYSISGKINTIREEKKIYIYQPSKEKNKLIIGANFILTPEFISIYPAASFLTKGGYMFSAGYDPLNKLYYFGISKELRLK